MRILKKLSEDTFEFDKKEYTYYQAILLQFAFIDSYRRRILDHALGTIVRAEMIAGYRSETRKSERLSSRDFFLHLTLKA